MVLAAHLPACTGYQTIEDPAPVVRAEKAPIERVRMTLRTGESVELEKARVSGDTVYGTVRKGGESRAIPLADASKLELRRPAPDKTIGLVIGLTAVAAAIAYGIVILDQIGQM
jgi:hypothetical protein